MFRGCGSASLWGCGSIFEREDKYEVGDEFVVPDLVGVADGAGVEPLEVLMVNTYFDTPDGDLRRRRVTLRRRVGGADEGWQLKIPREDARARDPDAARRRPRPATAAGRDPHAVWRWANHSNRLVAMMTTRRDHPGPRPRRHGVARGRRRPGRGRRRRRDGPAFALARGGGGTRLRPTAGAGRGAGADAPGRGVDRRGGVEAGPRAGYPRAAGSRTAAQAALADYLATQVDAILLGDLALRRGLDPIHDVRVAIRRLRSTLRVFGAQIAAPTELEEELKWFAGLLGEVRDREVQRRRFASAIAAIDPKYVLGPAAADLDATLNSEQVTARAGSRTRWTASGTGTCSPP